MGKDNAELLKEILGDMSSGKADSAFAKLLNCHKELFASYPKRTLLLLKELSIYLGRQDEGERAIEGLRELPYVDQQTEEMLRDFPLEIDRSKGKAEAMGLEDAIEILKGKDEKRAKKAIDYFYRHKAALPAGVDGLREYCLHGADYPSRQLCLQLLSLAHDPHVIHFKAGDAEFVGAPFELPNAKDVKRMEAAKKTIDQEKDTAVRETATELLVSAFAAYYPFPLPSFNLALACLILARRYLKLSDESSEEADTLQRAIDSHRPA